MWQHNQKIADGQGKIPLRKHVNLENRQKFYLLFFHVQKFDPHYFLKFHFHFSQNLHPCRISGPGATFQSQIPTPRAIFLANPRELPGLCTQLELTETLFQVISLRKWNKLTAYQI